MEIFFAHDSQTHLAPIRYPKKKIGEEKEAWLCQVNIGRSEQIVWSPLANGRPFNSFALAEEIVCAMFLV